LRILYGFLILLKMGVPVSTIFVIAQGDDAITWGIPEDRLDEYIKTALEYGIKLRDVVQNPSVVEFCSRDFREGVPGAPLTSLPKMVYRILTLPKGKLKLCDLYQSVHEARFNEESSTLRRWVEEIVDDEFMDDFLSEISEEFSDYGEVSDYTAADDSDE
jgi:hypothetical protein